MFGYSRLVEKYLTFPLKNTHAKNTLLKIHFLVVQEWKLPDNQNRNWQPTIFWSNLSEHNMLYNIYNIYIIYIICYIIYYMTFIHPNSWQILGSVGAKLFKNPKVWLTDKSTNRWRRVGSRDANASIDQLINIYFMSFTITFYQNIQRAARNPDSVTGWLTIISLKPVYTLFGPDLRCIV